RRRAATRAVRARTGPVPGAARTRHAPLPAAGRADFQPGPQAPDGAAAHHRATGPHAGRRRAGHRARRQPGGALVRPPGAAGRGRRRSRRHAASGADAGPLARGVRHRSRRAAASHPAGPAAGAAALGLVGRGRHARYHCARREGVSVPHSQFSAIQYRPLQEADLPQAHALSAALQWPHRLEDWRFGWRLGAGEAAWHGADLAGVALHWDYGTCMTLGHIIVAPAHQGQGIGGTLVARALRHAAAPAALLHATPAGAGVYARQGFGVVGQVAQHQGGVPAQLPAAGPLPAGVALRPLAPGDRAWAMAWDTAATGMRREALLGALWDTAQGVALMRAGQPAGFSLLRRAGRGWVVGPLVAPDLDGAQAM